MSRRDQGAASVWLLTVGIAVVSVGAMGAGIGAAVVARHQAQAAADMGALAAAIHVLEGRDAACGHARQIVTANHARLVECRIDGLDVVVRAEADPAGIAAVVGAAAATARAGPVVRV